MKVTVTLVAAMLLFRSPTDAQTIFWEQTSGFNATRVTGLVTNASGHLFAGTDSGVFRSTDNGASWTRSIALFSGIFSMAIDTEGRVVVAGVDSNKTFVFRSTDNGATWDRLGNGWRVCWGQLCFLPAVRLAVNAQQHVFAALDHYAFNEYFDDGIWRSTDHGSTWDSLASFGYLTRYTSLEIDRDDRVFAGIASNYNYPYPRVFKSTDDGTTWSRADSGLSESVSCFAFSSVNDAYTGSWNALTGNSVYRSTDNGYTWSFGDTVGGYISAMLFDNGDNFFVATSNSGVFRNGIQENSGLTDLNVTSLALSPTGYIYAGSSTGAVFRSVLPLVSVDDNSGENPESFLLQQNYPNPFNPSTRIGFRIQSSGFTALKVYDLVGREVASLVNEEMTPGSYEVSFDATGLAGGIYFYRLTTGSVVETKKLVVVR